MLTPDERAVQQRADALRAPALVESPESIHRHDPAVTRAFRAIFEHPDNADTARAFEVGLAVNDPVPDDEDTRPPAEGYGASSTSRVPETPGTAVGFSTITQEPDGYSQAGIALKDADGDEVRFLHVYPNTEDASKERVLVYIGGEAVALTIAQAEEVADFLDECLDPDDDEGAFA